MVAIQNAVSLNLVKDELDATLSQAETALEHFTEERANETYVDTFSESFGEIKGIFKMIELHGAQVLAEDLASVAQSFKDNIAGATDAKLSAVGNAIMMLGRYLEYVQVKRQYLPMLLVPTINGVRQQFQKPLMFESDFLDISLDIERANPPGGKAPGDTAELLKRLRKMYQVGLLTTLKEGGSETGYKMMMRAMQRMDYLNQDSSCLLWWAAQGLIQQLHGKALSLSASRKKLLAGIDRVLKGQIAGDVPTELVAGLTRDCLMNVAMGNVKEGVSGKLIEAFDLEKLDLAGVDLHLEAELMTGPGGSVIKTVAAALREELTQVKDNLEAVVEGRQADFETVSEALTSVGNTLLMLGLNKESQEIKDKSSVVAGWDSSNIEGLTDQFHGLVDDLLRIENAVAALERKFTAAENIGEGGEETKVSLYQLDSARVTVVGECRSGLSLLKRAISSFMETNWDKAHLNNIPETLGSVAGGLTFLELKRAEAILQACVRYTEEKLLAETGDDPTEEQMEVFADAISSIDYYLESMEENKPIGDGILEIGEQSMAELGFPVTVPDEEQA